MKSSQKLARSVTWLRSVRKVCLIAPLIFLLAACAGTPRYGTGAKQRVGRVYMFRGLIGLLTSGVDKFDRELRAEGFCAAAYEDIQSGFVANQIGRAWESERTHEPLILIGYSAGADAALAIARQLDREHIPVDLVVTLDPMVRTTVTSNVRVCENYYETIITGLPLFSGRRLDAAPSVQLTNINVGHSNVGEGMVNHFNLDEQRKLKAAVTAHMEKICPIRGEPVPMRWLRVKVNGDQ